MRDRGTDVIRERVIARQETRTRRTTSMFDSRHFCARRAPIRPSVCSTASICRRQFRRGNGVLPVPLSLPKDLGGRPRPTRMLRQEGAKTWTRKSVFASAAIVALGSLSLVTTGAAGPSALF